jgi:hypothetical protein
MSYIMPTKGNGSEIKGSLPSPEGSKQGSRQPWDELHDM